RGGWMASGIALTLLFGLLMRKRGQRLAGVIFFVLLIAAFVFFVKNLAVLQRRIRTIQAEEKVEDARLQLWRPAIGMWQDHPWWGVGPAQFDERFRSYRPDDIQMRPGYVHNDYLNTLADWGLTGMILIGASVGLLYLGVIQSWKYVQRANELASKRSNRSA